MKEIRTVDAVGQVLCHDITQIIKDVSKGPVFRKGHIITEEDIPVLLSVGKDHIFVWEKDDRMMHEDEAAEVLCRLCLGENITRTEAREGKIELRAACDGILKINRRALEAVNAFGQMMIATRHGDFPVHAGDKLAGTRIIPLVIEKETMEAVEAKVREILETEVRSVSGAKSQNPGECAMTPQDPGGSAPELAPPAILQVLPLQKKRVGIVTTGTEVFLGRIEDTFTPVVAAKVQEFGAEVVGHEYSDDVTEHIETAIRKLLEEGADMILCTGGMSVDPDDKTPAAIRKVCGNVVTYGAPVLPGAMFLLSYYGPDQIPVMGLPGCVMYARRTIFDLVLPRIMTGEILTKEDFDRLGEGGLCLDCEICTYPNCGFGK